MLECQKHLFDLDATQHYINGAYMSPITKATAEAGVHSVNRKLQPQNIFPIDFLQPLLILPVIFDSSGHVFYSDCTSEI